jgi:hypothetical protein
MPRVRLAWRRQRRPGNTRVDDPPGRERLSAVIQQRVLPVGLGCRSEGRSGNRSGAQPAEHPVTLHIHAHLEPRRGT